MSRCRHHSKWPPGIVTAAVSLALVTACGPGATNPSPPAPTSQASAARGSAISSSAAGSSQASTSAPASPATPGKPTDLVTGLTSPWGVASYRGKLFVTERDTLRILRIDGVRATELAVVADGDPSSEGGLLGVAISPVGDAMFVYYSTAQDNRIVRYPFDGSKITGRPQVILDKIPVAAIHNGGQLIFGPDGYLYASTGDATNRGAAQDVESQAGKILRLTADGDPAPDNPFDNAIWSLGHRNVQGLAFDDRGRLFASEFGQNTFDELNLIERGGNYGWPEIEGEGTGRERKYISPLATWATEDASPSGLAYADGSLWMAGLRGQRLWQIPLTGDGVGAPRAHFADDYGRLRAVIAGAGAVIVGTSNTDGRGAAKGGDDRLLQMPLD